jgi:hypothetical protein
MEKNFRRLLDEIKKSNELTLFFSKLWEEDSSLARFFFLHKEQLFPLENRFIIPFVFWSNAKEEMGKSILEISSELEGIKGQQAWNRLSFDKLPYEYKDLFAYFAVKVIRENDDIKKLVTDELFTFRKMKEVLGDYKKVNFDVLKQEEIESIPELNSIIKASLARFTETFDPIKLLEALSSTSGFVKMLPLMGIPHLMELLEITGLDFDEYTDIINELYILKLISNFQTLLWCEHCLDTLQVFVTTSRIAPGHLKMNCLKCKRQMLVSSIYNIDSLLKECVLLKDGLLAIALGWLFDSLKISWNFSVLGKYEDDFVLETKNGKVLCECKMHLIPKDERSLEGQLKQDLYQLVTHVEALLKEGIPLNQVYLIYNYDLREYSEELQRILDLPNLKNSIEQYRIEPIGFPEVPHVIESKGDST